MKPLTMSEGEEGAHRELSLYAAHTMQMTSAVRRQRNRKAVSSVLLGQAIEAAWAEVDALRTKLAEVEEQLGVVTLNDDMASGIFAELHEVLNSQPCPCGSKDHTSTPPMMYREWLLSVLAGWDRALAASQEREREMREAAKGLTMAMRGWGAEDDGIPETWMPEVEFAQQCLARPTDDSALRGLCACAWIAGAQANNNPFDGGVIEPGDWHDRAAKYVNEVLGPGAAPIAAEIKEKE